MKDLHPIQNDILRKLLFSTSLRFTEIKPYKLENSQFTFHIDSLIKDNLVQKDIDGYSLTQKGKEFANRMDTSSEKIKLQAKVTTILCCQRIENGITQFLIYKRLKNPFFNHMGFPTHKIWFGEKFTDAAEKGLTEECNLKGKAELIAIRHYHVYSNNLLVEDKIMHIFRFTNITGELLNIRDGEYQWLNEDDISKKVLQPLPEFKETFELLTSKNKFCFFEEKDQIVDSF